MNEKFLKNVIIGLSVAAGIIVFAATQNKKEPIEITLEPEKIEDTRE